MLADIDAASVKPTKQKLHIFNHAELVDEVESRRRTAMVLTAISGAAGAMSASQAGYSQTTGSYTRSSAYGNSSGTYTATTYNPAMAQAAADANSYRTASNMASIEDQAQLALSRLQNDIIKDHTLMPGEWHGGVLVLDAPEKSQSNAAEYAITIRYDGEEHAFSVIPSGRN